MNKPDEIENKGTPARARLITAATVMLLGVVGLFFLLQSQSLWASPTLIRDRWHQFFYPIRDLFPETWRRAPQDSAYGMLNALLYLGILALLLVAYLRLISLVRDMSPSHAMRRLVTARSIVLFTGLLGAVLLVAPGMFSTDPFIYVYYGRIAAEFGGNPTITVPADYAWSDPDNMLQWVYWRETPSAYGPVWIWIAAGIATVARALDGDIVTHLLGHRFITFGAHLLNIFLVWRLSAYFAPRSNWLKGDDPKAKQGHTLEAVRLAMTTTYALSPLALIEFGVSSHNDVFVVTAIALSLLLHISGRWRLALVALTLGALVKVSAALIIPAYIWLLLWERGRSERRWHSPRVLAIVAQAIAIIGLCSVGVYWRFWEGTQSLNAIIGGPPAQFYIHSLGSIIRNNFAEGIAVLAAAGGWEPARFWSADSVGWRLDWPARWGLLIIAAAIAITNTWNARTVVGMVTAWGWTFLAYLTVGAAWFWPWYVTWLLVPAVLIGPGRLFWATQTLAASSLLLYAIWPKVAPPLAWLSDWTGLVIMGPPFAYLALSAERERRARRARRARVAPASTSPQPVAPDTPMLPPAEREGLGIVASS